MALIETALTRLLGIDHPILLAPMGAKLAMLDLLLPSRMRAVSA